MSDKHVRQSRRERFDLISVWLLLLFVALFFGVAAQEAKKPSIFSSTENAASGMSSIDSLRHGFDAGANR